MGYEFLRLTGSILIFTAVLAAQNQAITTVQYNSNRTSANVSETVLNTTNVNSGSFGKLFSWPVDGFIFAQPLYLPNLNIKGATRNVIFVATMNNSIYAFDAGQSGSTPLWHVQLGGPVTTAGPYCPSFSSSNGNVLGIQSTPVIDTSTNTLYAVASNQGSGGYYLKLHAIDILTGLDKSPAVTITGMGNSTGLTGTQAQRTGLLLANGKIYAGIANCGPDSGVFHGYITIHDETSLAQLAIFNSTPHGAEGGIWQSGGGGVVDSAGNVYFNTGNETPVGSDYASSVLKLSSSGSVLNSFSPSDAAILNEYDLDVSSAGPIQISGSVLVSGGKDGMVYVLNEANLSLQQSFQATQSCPQPTNSGCYQIHQLVFWNNTLYVWGGNDILRSFIYSNGSFSAGPLNNSTTLVDYWGAPMAVSANGSDATTAILWGIDISGVFHAFKASNVATELWNSNMNPARDALPSPQKFTIPTVVNGRVYVPTSSNQLVVYGLLPPSDFTITATPSTQDLPAGDSTTYVVEVAPSPLNGSEGTVALSVTGLPSGVTAAFSPTSITGSGYSTLTVAAGSTANIGTYNLTITGTNGTQTHSIAATLNIPLTTQSGGGTSGFGFFPVTPCRVADTRSSAGFNGPFGPPTMSAGQTRSIPILASSCGIPAGALAYALNITVVPPAPLGYLTVWPAGKAQPVVSTLNSSDAQVVANAAIVPASSAGIISVYVSDATDVIIDINGYFGAVDTAALAFYPVKPCRVADTRGFGFTGAFGPPSLAAQQTRSFPILSSSCGIPLTAQAYSLNMTVVPPGPMEYLSVWPNGQSQPVVSTLNSFNGRVVANAAIVPAGLSGAIDVYASNNTDLIIDIDGYFAPPGAPGAIYLYPVTPCRVADTRASSGFTGAFGPPSLAAGVPRNFPIQSSACGVPATSQAYSLNMTVVPPGPLTYLSVWPTGQTQPVVSTLNSFNGTVVANAALVPAGSNGSVSVYASNATDLIIDINAYFAP